MKHIFVSLLIMLACVPAFSNSLQKSQPKDQQPLRSAAQTRIAVVSDIHVMAPSLLPEEAKSQDAWKNYYAGDRKMLEQSVELFDQFLTAVSNSADILLITGDLTKDGELDSHKYVVQKLKASGLKKIYVIPGNHDFGGSGNATKFNADGTTEAATVVTVKNFKNGYAAFGYGEGSTLDPNGSLSYVAEPVEGLVLLGIDSHTSSIPSETLTWLCDQAKDARANGKQVIAMMHHPLVEHIKGASMYISTYTVGSNTAVRDALIEAGVKVILTGHFHASDIAYDWNDDEANGIYDINTGSLISYPCDYRLLTLSEDMQTLHVATESLNPAGSEEWLHGRLEALAKSKMNAKAGSYAPFVATYINELADFAADLFILHAKGDENSEANAEEREGLKTRYRGYKRDFVYSAALGYGGIEDASIYSVLDNKSHYGENHECQTADRTLDITLPSLGGTSGEDDDVEENYHIENGVTAAFMNEVDYTYEDYSVTKITDYKDIHTDYRKDLPSPVRIEAPMTKGGETLLLETYCNGTLVRSDNFPVGQRALEIWNLIPQTEYTYKLYLVASDGTKSKVTDGSFKTEGQVRMMNIEGMYNFRDIGGWKLAGGMRIKYDKIFRSGELEMGDQVKITAPGRHELLDVQHIGVEIDFSDYPGSPVSDQLDYYNGDSYQIEPYTEGLQDYGEQFKNCFEQVLDGLRQGKKILFHCNLGADRTGTFAFLLEGLLRVSESDLAKEYELTNFVFDERYRNSRFKGAIKYINETFNGNSLHEKIEQMAIGMGISKEDINEFRSLMSEPDVEMTVEENYNIENGVTAAFMNEVDYTNDDDYSVTKITDYMAIPTSYRKDLPSPVRIEAPITKGGESLLLETYCNETLVRSDNYLVGQRVLEIWNLIPQAEYTYKLYQIATDGTKSKVTDGSFKTEGQMRMINISGMYNFRDIGGWQLADGKYVKYDKIFRSGELEMGNQMITEDGIHELMDVLHIGVEIDFGDYPGSPVSDQLDYYNDDDYQISQYARGLYRKGEQYKNCFEQVVAGLRQGKKILFNCNKGADRTGTFAFLLEGLLGVSESDMAKDYELTSFIYKDRYRNVDEENHQQGYKGLIWYVNNKFNGNTLHEKIEDMALKMGVTQKDINDFRTLMIDSDGQTTGISSIRHNDSKDVYDLSGRKVGTNTSRLPKGIYIVNGRKVVVM
jgi:3',5'-cyclic AMP phosphodiesterase CpdA/protein tyrosine/serine phosphatase